VKEVSIVFQDEPRRCGERRDTQVAGVGVPALSGAADVAALTDEFYMAIAAAMPRNTKKVGTLLGCSRWRP
jgi:hypothetical protein